MADKDKIIQTAEANMKAGKLQAAYKLTQRREVERLPVARALGGLILCKGGNLEQGTPVLRALMGETLSDFRTLTYVDQGASLAGLYSESEAMWSRCAAAKPDDMRVAYHHVLSMVRKGSLTEAQARAAALAKTTNSGFFLELAALTNHMLATDEMLAGRMPVLGQAGVSPSSVAATTGGMTLAVAEAQLRKAMPAESLPIDADGAVVMEVARRRAAEARREAAAAERASGGGAAASASAASAAGAAKAEEPDAFDDEETPEVVREALLPASESATLLTVHTLRRLGRFEEALKVLDDMSGRGREVAEATAKWSEKTAAKALKEIAAQEAAKAEAKGEEGAAGGASDAAEAKAAAADDAAAAVTAARDTGRTDTREIEQAAAYARRRQLPMSRRRAEAIDLRCAMGDWAGAYAEAVRLVRGHPGDVLVLAAAMQSCLQHLAAKAAEAAGAGRPTGLDALAVPVEGDAAAFATDAAAEDAAREAEAPFVRQWLQKSVAESDAERLRAVRVRILGANTRPSPMERDALRAAVTIADKALAVEDSDAPEPTVAHLRGLLRATQEQSVVTTRTSYTRAGISALAQALAEGKGSDEAEAARAEADAKSIADAKKAAAERDEAARDVAAEAKASAESEAAAAAAAGAGDDASAAGAAAAASAAPAVATADEEDEEEAKAKATGGRMELAALLLEADLELRILDATGGTAGSGGSLPEGTADMPGGEAVAALHASGDPAALLVALLARALRRFGGILLLPRELGRALQPFVDASHVGLGPGDVDEAELSRAGTIRWRASALPREVLAVAGDHIRAAPAPSLFGQNSPFNTGEAPLRGGMRTPAFKASEAARKALAACFAAERDAARPAPEDRPALDAAFDRAAARFETDSAEYKRLREEILAAQERGDKEEVARLGRSFNRTPPQLTLDGPDTAVVRGVEAKAARYSTASRLLRLAGATAPAVLGEEGLLAELKDLEAAFAAVEPLLRLSKPQDDGAQGEEGVVDFLLLQLARTAADVAELRWNRATALRAAGDEAGAAAAERGWWRALLDAILVVETRVAKGGTGQVALLLMSLYSRAGAMGQVKFLFDALGVRSFSLESASYLFLPHALRLGGYTEARDLCTAIVAMHAENDRILPGRVAAAASRSNVAAALDLALFRRRLEHSLQRSEAQSIVGIISVPSDRLNTTRDWLRDKVGPSGTGVGCDTDFFCPMSEASTAAACTDNIDREIATELDPHAGPVSSVGRRALAYRHRQRALAGIEHRRLLLLALHAVANCRKGPLGTVLPAVHAASARLGLLRDDPAAPPALAPLLLGAPDGAPAPVPADGEGFEAVGFRAIGTHALPAATTHAMWGAAILSLRAASAVFRAFAAPETAPGSGVRAARASAEPGTVDFDACKEATAALDALSAAAEPLVDAIVGSPLVPSGDDDATAAAAAASASSSGRAGAAAADDSGDLTKAAAWRRGLMRPCFVVAASRFVGEVMAVIPLCFGAMAAYVPKADGKGKKGKKGKKGGKGKVVKAGKAGKAGKAPATDEAKAAEDVTGALSETAFRLNKALDRLSKTLGAARSGLGAAAGKDEADEWAEASAEASLLPALLVGDASAEDAAKGPKVRGICVQAIRDGWADSLGRMQDTLRERVAMLRDASVL